MLFNSFVFLLAFLPASIALQALVERFAPTLRLHCLLLLSFAFYGYWDWRFIPLLAGSILFNWLLARLFSAVQIKAVLTAAVCADLALLALFKYLGLLEQASNLLGLFSVTPMSFALPLGISFFTFHHIMYLTDLRAGRAPAFGLLRYALYIAFFPQVLAGPLVRWREIMHQFDAPNRMDFSENFGRGLILLSIGLVKKTLIGDPLAEVAAPAFDAAQNGGLALWQAWEGLVAFTLQIYFDFSGYTDMALGIALLFGLVLPQNFAVPYRATTIAEFWRRWHMTLSRFLRDYLYIPLGGNRHGRAVQVAALLVTMGLGGLWHGAGLSFLAWGFFHGAGLVVHLLWRSAGGAMPSWLGGVLTILFVMMGWVLFRAPTFEIAAAYYKALLGVGAHGHPHRLAGLIAPALIATVGPTAWDFAHKRRPSMALSLGLGLAMTLVILKIGSDTTYEFIYFKF